MTAFDWIWELNMAVGGFWSTEKPKEKASNGELRRWFKKSCIKINGCVVQAETKIEKLEELVLFPKNDNKRISFLFNTKDN